MPAEDEPSDLAKPSGKQDWELEPHGILYPRTTGIWQSVWWERVPATAIAQLDWTACISIWEIGLHARLDGVARDDLSLRVHLEVPPPMDRFESASRSATTPSGSWPASPTGASVWSITAAMTPGWGCKGVLNSQR